MISIRIARIYGSQPSSEAFACKTRLLDQNYKSPWVPDLTCHFVHAKQRDSTRIKSLHGSQTTPVVSCMQYSMISTRITRFHGFQQASVILGIQNRDFWTRITSLYGSQTSPVVLCMQNRVINTRITSLYRSQPSSVVFSCKTATFWSELQVSIGTRPHLSFCACITA